MKRLWIWTLKLKKKIDLKLIQIQKKNILNIANITVKRNNKSFEQYSNKQ